MNDLFSTPIGILTITLVSITLVFLLYKISKSRLLFKSSLKGTKKSIVSVTFLTILYTISFSLNSSGRIYVDRANRMTQRITQESNYFQMAIQSDERTREINDPRYDDDMNPHYKINRDLWVTDLGPTMEAMYPGEDFSSWQLIEDFIMSKEYDQFISPVEQSNIRFINEFLSIYHYQNENFDEGDPRKTLPQINFGFKLMPTFSMSFVDNPNIFVTALRLEPEGRGINKPIYPHNVEVNKASLVDGNLSDPNDPNIGLDETNRVGVTMFSDFGEANNLNFGDTITLNPISREFPNNPITTIELNTELIGYSDIAELAYTVPTVLQIIPDYTKQTYMQLPFDAFNSIAQRAGESIRIQYQFNIAFSDYWERIQSGESLNEIELIKSESRYNFIETTYLRFEQEFYRYFRRDPLDHKFFDESNSDYENFIVRDQGYTVQWNNSFNQYASGLQAVYAFINMTEETNFIMTMIFLVINLLFIFMVLNRKTKDLSKQIGILKSMGYKSSEISASFTSYALIIVVVGGLLSIISGLFLQQQFMNMTMRFFTFTIPPAVPVIDVWISSILTPLMFISVFVWMMVYIIINKKTIELLNNTSINKPNIFVRNSGYLTSKLSFTNAYAFKNSMRAIGKSSVILGSVLFSSLFLVFGVTTLSFPSKVNENTLAMLNYDDWYMSREPYVSADVESIDLFINQDNLQSYSFGVHHDYWSLSNDVVGNPRYDHLEFDGQQGSTHYRHDNPIHNFTAIEYDLSRYMGVDEVVSRDTHAFINDYETLSSFSNILLLIERLLTSGNADLINTRMVYNDGTEIKSFGNFTVANIAFAMTTIYSEFLKFEDNPNTNQGTIKILFDIYENIDDTIQSHVNEHPIQFHEVNGTPIEISGALGNNRDNLVISNRNEVTNDFIRFRDSRGNNLSQRLANWSESNNRIPAIIDTPTSRLHGINSGDVILIQSGYDTLPHWDDNAVNAEIEVVGIYDSYISFGWRTLFDFQSVNDFYVESSLANDEDWNNPVNGAWYNMPGSPFSHSNVRNHFTVGNANDNRLHRYGCFSTSTTEESFMLIDSIEHNIFRSMAACDVINLDRETVAQTSQEMIFVVEEMFGFFVGFAFIIVAFILLVIGNETIQSSRKEVSTLKALGYNPRTNAFIVLIGHISIMFISVAAALPLGIGILSIVSQILARFVGIHIDFTPSILEVIWIAGIIISFALLIYLMGWGYYKWRTSQLESLYRD